jgi:sterol desaturase/sphingolipid hydroxylase (fatty acid hydroxylase superfamily)
VFLHANTRVRFGPLRWILATPEFHHWNHAAQAEAVDKNFAVHLPLIDRIFGTAWLPDRWPACYGIAGDPVPEGWLRQLVWPLGRRAGSVAASPFGPVERLGRLAARLVRRG